MISFQEKLERRMATSTSRKVLVCGSGRVVSPCIKVLLKRQCSVTIVSMIQDELDVLSATYPGVQVLHIDVSKDTEQVHNLVAQHDLVVSLVPPPLHAAIAEHCIELKRCMVMASYVLENLKALNDKAVAAGVTILCEAGLDPGIDHMIALRCIDSITERNGQITSYDSVCGGLPAPECSRVPLRYKFSWYPKGVLLSAIANSVYLKNGKRVEVSAQDLDKIPDPSLKVPDQMIGDEELEVIPNRDSLKYVDLYGIQSASAVFRGTFRYKGYNDVIKAFSSLRLLETEEKSFLSAGSDPITWKDLMARLLDLPQQSSYVQVREQLHERFGRNDLVTDTVVKLGLLDETLVPLLGAPVDVLTAQLLSCDSLSFGPEERDMVLMRTKIEAKFPDDYRESHNFELVCYGQPNGHSAMSLTVGLTIGECSCLLLDGKVKRSGIILPTTPDIYTPVLQLLEEEGIHVDSDIETCSL
ncbi:alpha-aminoadipic semialdehyde synthase, mitochondrial [Aplysia californica]|uniref:Alpha-aminoadipic semialdehyde synthase, mitochondrial n=1 Tax=Aplysia californica TaxID=6500 RepID=A0ABM0JEZ9_APLCA|nr:alpha-aminoadipic semialdehyde synthase, mitochondrial [Aplysia californica]